MALDAGKSVWSARYVPDGWIEPFDLAAVFGTAPQRLEVDVGCGRGRFLLAKAAAEPGTCFLGIERLLKRVEQVARKAEAAGLLNVRVLYCDAYYAVRYLLPRQSVSVLYILFSDPWPKRRHRQRRLVNAEFAEAMAGALKPGGLVHIATDDADYFKRIQEVFGAVAGFESAPPFEPREDERTDYEMEFLREGRRIYRVSFLWRGVA